MQFIDGTNVASVDIALLYHSIAGPFSRPPLSVEKQSQMPVLLSNA
jgi:hypothetical protein